MLLGAVILGLLAGIEPVLAIAAVIGLLLAVITFTNLTAGLCTFIVVAFLEALPHVAGLTSVSKTMGILLIAGWLAGAAAHHIGERRSRDLLARHPLLVW